MSYLRLDNRDNGNTEYPEKIQTTIQSRGAGDGKPMACPEARIQLSQACLESYDSLSVASEHVAVRRELGESFPLREKGVVMSLTQKQSLSHQRGAQSRSCHSITSPDLD